MAQTNMIHNEEGLPVTRIDPKHYEKVYSKILSSYDEFLKEKIHLAEVAEKQLQMAEASGNQSRIDAATKAYKKAIEDRYTAERDYISKNATAAAKADEEAKKIAYKASVSYYKSLSAMKKYEYNTQLKEELKQEQSANAQRLQQLKDLLKDEAVVKDTELKAQLEEELKTLKDSSEKNNKQIEAVTKRNKKLSVVAGLLGKTPSVEKRFESSMAHREEAASKKRLAKDTLKESDEYKKAKDELKQKIALDKKNRTDTSKADVKAAKQKLKQIEDEAGLTEANHEAHMAQLEAAGATMKGLQEGISRAASVVLDKTADSISGNVEAMFGSQGKMMGRLQGSAIDWAETVDSVSDTIGFSGMVSKKSVVAKMVDLVDSGVAYNLEMRAFLAETSENIASTFDATNGTLLRLVRLQQADTTAARLGMEAALTSLFNEFFEDSSYLASDVSQNVTDAIVDATTTMARNQSVEFEYTLQKWLGSLYSLGMSSEAVNQIATGINYLGSGNASALSGNTALQTLLTMSAGRIEGKSYSDMLTQGLTADDTNKLLRSMIEYLAEIAKSQDNLVTKSAYAELFGMSITDLSTFASLTTEEINSLYNTSKDYTALVDETQNQLTQVYSRMHMSQIVDNAIDNALVGAASTIGSNAGLYGTWKALSLLKDSVGKIEIPGFLVAGSGTSSIDLLNVAQTGMVGIGLVGSLLGALGSIGNGGAGNLANWDNQETVKRGSGLIDLDKGSAVDTSYSLRLGVVNAGADDVESVSLAAAQDAGQSAAGVTSEEIQESKDLPAKTYEALSEGTPNVLDLLQEIDNRLDPNRVFYTAIAGTLRSDAANQIFNLSSQLATAQATATTSTTENSKESLELMTKAVDSIGGSSLISGSEGVVTLEEAITRAIETAISTVMSEYTTNGLPVTLVNGGFYT